MQFIGNMWVEMGNQSKVGPQGGIMNTLVGDNDKLQQFVTKLFFGVIALPLCFKRQLSELRFVSVGVVLFCIVASTVVCIKSVQIIADAEDGPPGVHGPPFDLPKVGTLLDQVPNAAFGFSSIVELFHVRAEIKNPDAMPKCAHMASVLVCTLYVCVGLIGALAFADPGSNLLENFPDSHLVSFLRLGIVVMITLLYPIINFPCVQAIDALRGKFTAPSMRRWRIMSVLGLVFVLTIDTAISDLGPVFGLAGALGLGPVAYALPCSAFIAVSMKQRSRVPVSAIMIISAVVVLIAGLTMTIGSTAWVIRGVIVKPA
jgi:amino acid permease